MTRLIDADALKKVIFSKSDSMEDLWDTAGVLNAINNAPTVEPPNQLVLRARDDSELEQLKEAWSKGTINFTPIVAYTEIPQDRWGKWVVSEIQCPNCLEYFLTDCYSTEELNKCPCCNAKMRGGAEE